MSDRPHIRPDGHGWALIAADGRRLSWHPSYLAAVAALEAELWP